MDVTEIAMQKVRQAQALEYMEARIPPNKVELTVAPGSRITYSLCFRKSVIGDDEHYRLMHSPDGYGALPKEVSLDRMLVVMQRVFKKYSIGHAF